MTNEEKSNELSKRGFKDFNNPYTRVTVNHIKDCCLEIAQWKDEQFKEQLNNLKDEIQNNLCASSGFHDKYSYGYQDCGMKVMKMIDKVLDNEHNTTTKD